MDPIHETISTFNPQTACGKINEYLKSLGLPDASSCTASQTSIALRFRPEQPENTYTTVTFHSGVSYLTRNESLGKMRLLHLCQKTLQFDGKEESIRFEFSTPVKEDCAQQSKR